MDVCRTCLDKNPEKDLIQLHIGKKSTVTYFDIMMFCLNIEIGDNSKITTKLCLRCYKKIVAFYKFKSLAMKNDGYLKSLDLNSPIFIEEEDCKIKKEDLSVSDVSQDVDDNISVRNSEDISIEICLKAEPDPISNLDSDDELLSAIKKIKYEYVLEDDSAPLVAEESITALPLNKSLKKKRKRSKIICKSEPNEKQMCEECGKTVSDLKAHSFLHLPVSERKRIKCRVCDKMFSSHSARYKHNKIKHLGVKTHCNICNKDVTHIGQHNKVMHNKDALKYECMECGRRFVSKSSLELHTRQHTKDRPFECDLCDKKFISNALLQQHKRAVHDKEKSHMCQLCSKSFFKKYHLQKHIMSHSKESTLECPDCGKFYKTVSTLQSHRLLHGDLKNFACQLCSMTFKKKPYLIAHMISHKKEKRYPCQYCGVRFHRSDHRKRHEFTAHQKHLIASTTANST